jgi:hypothetical protein
MKRRTFIIASIAAGTAIAIPVLYNRYENAKWNKQPLIHPLILSHFNDEEAIRKIGVSYRSSVPSENSEKQLLTLLLPGSGGKKLEISDNSIDSQQLEEKSQQDFKADKVIIVNGWVLSVTEARQCALLSFS